MAAVYLQQAYGDEFLNLNIPFVERLDQKKWMSIRQMIRSGLNCPSTSSLGRLFDAVAALVGLRAEVQYEGQAAIELESQATPTKSGYPFDIQDGQFDVRLLIRAIVANLVRGIPIPEISGRLHRSIAEMLLRACQTARAQAGMVDVALSGGVFQNKLLLEQLLLLLEADGFKVYINRLVPPNDGGLSLGQAAIAAARLAEPNEQWQRGSYVVPASNFATMKRS
jgi:hydrogenase maturation protein HypF